jgi:hypothetical protein
VRPSSTTGVAVEMELVLVPLHSRSHTTFQLAALTRGPDAPSGLSLQKRRLLPETAATRAALATGDLAGGIRGMQSCLVGSLPGGHARGGVTQEQLGSLVSARSVVVEAGRSNTLAGRFQQGLRALGLSPGLRWQCLLVSVNGSKKNVSREQLTHFWAAAINPLAELAP